MGNVNFFMKQLIAVLVSSAWAFVFTYGMLWLINKVTHVRVDDQNEIDGLDSSQHGETAYLA